jgi:transcriptional regulator with XRE-family HTH domain
MNKKAFGQHLKLARVRKGLKIQELGKLISVSPKTISEIESGTHFTRLSVLVSICNVLNISPEYLFSHEFDTMLLEANEKHRNIYEKILKLNTSERKRIEDIINYTINYRRQKTDSSFIP